MTALPVDVALAVAAAGVDVELPDEALERALGDAIASRRGYHSGPELTEVGFAVELLVPVRKSFEGCAPAPAPAWCLVLMLGETGEMRIGAFSA